MTHNDAEIALAALDKALSDRPKAVYNDLIAAVRCLVALRDRLIAEYRSGDPDAGKRLQRMNAVFSLVVAAEYPLEGVRRERIETARRELASLFS